MENLILICNNIMNENSLDILSEILSKEICRIIIETQKGRQI